MIDRQKNNVLRLFALALCVATLTISGCNNRESAKITLTAEMIINEVAKGDASLLIDEQGTSDGSLVISINTVRHPVCKV